MMHFLRELKDEADLWLLAAFVYLDLLNQRNKRGRVGYHMSFRSALRVTRYSRRRNREWKRDRERDAK